MTHAAATTVQDHDNCALPLVRRVHALLGRDDSGLRVGDPLPRGWHFILFTPTDPQTIIGADGTPRRGDSDAPPELPRRMMGGRRFTFFSDIPIGANVTRTTQVLSRAEKSGRSGRFMIQTTRQLITVEGESKPALQEDFDTLFRAPASAEPSGETGAPEPRRDADHRERVTFDETMLFRYSACTFNAHRIHYDHPYTTGVEGYPAVVVNAGLTVLMLREFGLRLNDMPLSSMTTRNGRPLYCGAPLTLCAKLTPDEIQLWAENDRRQICAEVTLRK
jgi:3-methylfumaryl-CoA hydratase